MYGSGLYRHEAFHPLTRVSTGGPGSPSRTTDYNDITRTQLCTQISTFERCNWRWAPSPRIAQHAMAMRRGCAMFNTETVLEREYTFNYTMPQEHAEHMYGLVDHFVYSTCQKLLSQVAADPVVVERYQTRAARSAQDVLLDENVVFCIQHCSVQYYGSRGTVDFEATIAVYIPLCHR